MTMCRKFLITGAMTGGALLSMIAMPSNAGQCPAGQQGSNARLGYFTRPLPLLRLAKWVKIGQFIARYSLIETVGA